MTLSIATIVPHMAMTFLNTHPDGAVPKRASLSIPVFLYCPYRRSLFTGKFSEALPHSSKNNDLTGVPTLDKGILANFAAPI